MNAPQTEKPIVAQASLTTEAKKGGAIVGYLLLGLVLPILGALFAYAHGIPKPAVHDEFSYLFMADTFALGRITNPAHPLSEFFQTFHIIHHNGVYVSKYFPGIGLQLLIGELLGHPILGVWLTIGLFGVSLLFFLRRFFPAIPALFASFVCSLQFLVFTYFGHSYWGGSLMALAGLWVLGGTVFSVKLGQMRYAWLSATGLVICILTRPFEGFFFSCPLIAWQIFALNTSRVPGTKRWQLLAPVGIGIGFALLALAFYNQKITGDWKLLPHSYYERIYIPHGVRFLWDRNHSADDSFSKSLPMPFQRVREDYFTTHQKRTENFLSLKLESARRGILFYFPWNIVWLTLPAFILKANRRDPLFRLCVLVGIMRLAAFLLSWSSAHPHYGGLWLSPLAVMTAYGLRSILTDKRISLMFFIPVYLLAVRDLYRLNSGKEVLKQRIAPWAEWMQWTSYKNHGLKAREAISEYLDVPPPKDLVFVRYGTNHSVHLEWVYNSPEIDAQEVVWAHDLGEVKDLQLINYYRDRVVWRAIVEDDQSANLEKWNPSMQRFDSIRSFHD